jgi:ribA/ribD-fused uncharacterized protein
MVLFWGDEHPEWKALSNFAGGPLRIDHPLRPGTADYRTVEHWFQAGKTLDLERHEHIRCAPGPKEAKRRGRAVDLRPDWAAVKVDVMLVALRAKFAMPEYRELLLSTGSRPIGEDSPHDFEWGVRDRRGGYTGKNLLGAALERVRAEIVRGGG